VHSGAGQSGIEMTRHCELATPNHIHTGDCFVGLIRSHKLEN